jgi:hypothetical protein
MDLNNEAQAVNLAENRKRKSDSGTELANSNKRPNNNTLEGAQLTGGEQPVPAKVPDNYNLRVEIGKMEYQVRTKLYMNMRTELMKHPDSLNRNKNPRRTPKLRSRRTKVLSDSIKFSLLPTLAPCKKKSPRP